MPTGLRTRPYRAARQQSGFKEVTLAGAAAEEGGPLFDGIIDVAPDLQDTRAIDERARRGARGGAVANF